jgi:tripartite-type tricarboxylate transporter receptor subunit TctC
VHVPYNGTQPEKIALLGGHINIAVGPVSVMRPNIRSGELIALVTTSRARIADLPNVPTVEEAGAPQAAFSLWLGLFVPAKTPKAIVDRLSAALAGALKDQKVVESAERSGMLLEMTEPAQAISRLQAEYDSVMELAKTVRLTQ